MAERDDLYIPPVDLCAMCGEVYCDGIACVADIDPNDESDHPRLERLQDWVRMGRAWELAQQALADAGTGKAPSRG